MILSKNISVFVLSFVFMSCGKIHIQAGDAKAANTQEKPEQKSLDSSQEDKTKTSISGPVFPPTKPGKTIIDQPEPLPAAKDDAKDDKLMPLPGPKDDFKVCTEEARYGLTVNLKDKVSMKPVAKAVVKITDGKYTETLQEREEFSATLPTFPNDQVVSYAPYMGAMERAGVYVVTIAAKGFRDRKIENVEVKKGECHVIPAILNFEMESDVVGSK